MLDVSVSFNRFKFLGGEFLTWLWFVIENDQETIQDSQGNLVALAIGDRIVLENRRSDTLETVAIKGDEADLEEGRLALRKGAYVTELNLVCRAGDKDWRFTLKGESLHFLSFKCPKTAPLESPEDIEGAVLEKIYLCEQAIQVTDTLFRRFITLRVSADWDKKTVPHVKKWIRP